MTTATMTRPSAVPQAGGSGRAIALALLMHLLLGGLLFFGIRWQSSPPEVIQAELWSATPQTAAPLPRPAVIQPAPPPKVEVPKPDPVPDPPKVKVDIAEKAPLKKVEPPKKKEPVKVEAPKPVPKAQPAPPPAKVVPKINPELQKLQQQAAVEAPQRPPSELNSLLAAAGKEANGKDSQTSGPRGRDSYIARLVTAIRSQMRYPASATGNPFVTMRIDQLPNGEVTSVTVRKPSGVPAFDEAVERAIRAASPLPRDEQGKVERVLELDYKMYEKG